MDLQIIEHHPKREEGIAAVVYPSVNCWNSTKRPDARPWPKSDNWSNPCSNRWTCGVHHNPVLNHFDYRSAEYD